MGIAFTQQLLIVQHAANELAAQHQQMIGPPHMLAAILNAKHSGGYRLLDRLTSVVPLNSEIQSLIGQQPPDHVDNTVNRSRGLARRACKLGQGMKRPVQVGRSVYEYEFFHVIHVSSIVNTSELSDPSPV